MSPPLRVAIIGSARFPIAEPFAGGLESHTWTLAKALCQGGHAVTVFAAPGSDPTLPVSYLPVRSPSLSDAARADVAMGAERDMIEHHAYMQLMLDLVDHPDRYDVIHNNSLHYLPVAMSPALRTPMITTLHTPPTPWLESAIQLTSREKGRRDRPQRAGYAAVSEYTAKAWSHLVDAKVVPNGIDLSCWTAGAGGGPLCWFGRITPEKGTHLAVTAARLAGYPLRIAGPICDPGYYHQQVKPLLGDSVRYVGHLTQEQLTREVGAASAALVTPCWDEPYGLVVAEALACGTPVAGFRAGGVPEIVDDSCARLVPTADVEALATAIPTVTGLDRAAARARVVRAWSHERMVEHYLRCYRQMCA